MSHTFAAECLIAPFTNAIPTNYLSPLCQHLTLRPKPTPT